MVLGLPAVDVCSSASARLGQLFTGASGRGRDRLVFFGGVVHIQVSMMGMDAHMLACRQQKVQNTQCHFLPEPMHRSLLLFYVSDESIPSSFPNFLKPLETCEARRVVHRSILCENGQSALCKLLSSAFLACSYYSYIPQQRSFRSPCLNFLFVLAYTITVTRLHMTNELL